MDKQLDRSNYRLEGQNILIEGANPALYLNNAFRITGLTVDASTRTIRRRIDDLKSASDIGHGDAEHTHAFALYPSPTIDQIRDAAQRLQDAERRIVEEFFWFWPLEWGKGTTDFGLSAIHKGDFSGAIDFWTATSDQVVSKHNLAVIYQLMAMDAEYVMLENTGFDQLKIKVAPYLQIDLNDFNSNSPKAAERIAEYWRKSFKFWEDLTEDELFWSLISERIRILDDARVTTGFTRRIRGSLPEAMDKINATLAIQYAEKNKPAFVNAHLSFMKETHQGKDNVLRTLLEAIKPLKVRIQTLSESSIAKTQQNPTQGCIAALDLIEGTIRPFRVIDLMLPIDVQERIDLHDQVANACLKCQVLDARETNNWADSVVVLQKAEDIAMSVETKAHLKEQKGICADRNEREKPCYVKLRKELDRISTLKEFEKVHIIYNFIAPMLSKIKKDEGEDSTAYRMSADAVAIDLRGIAIEFFNNLKKFNTKEGMASVLFLVIEIHDKAKSLVYDIELKKKFAEDEEVLKDSRKLVKKDFSVRKYLKRCGVNLVWGGGKEPIASVILSYVLTYTTASISWTFKGGWIFLLIGYSVLASVFSNNHSQSNSSSTRSSYRSSRDSELASIKSQINVLAQDIETNKQNVENLAEQVKAKESEMLSLKQDIDSIDSQYSGATYIPQDVKDSYDGKVSEYNNMVPAYNELVAQQKTAYQEYERVLNEHNALVESYNQKIR